MRWRSSARRLNTAGLWRTALEDMALFAFEFEDVERLSERMLRRSLPAKIVERADDARRSGEVTFAEFHTFGAWDA